MRRDITIREGGFLTYRKRCPCNKMSNPFFRVGGKINANNLGNMVDQSLLNVVFNSFLFEKLAPSVLFLFFDWFLFIFLLWRWKAKKNEIQRCFLLAHPGPERAWNQKSASGASYAWFESKSVLDMKKMLLFKTSVKCYFNYMKIWVFINVYSSDNHSYKIKICDLIKVYLGFNLMFLRKYIICDRTSVVWSFTWQQANWKEKTFVILSFYQQLRHTIQ